MPSLRYTTRPRLRSAFTLIEVLMVVTILGIVGSVVVPQVTASHQFVAQAAARSLIANLNSAQNEAIARQEPVGVKFMPAQNRYRLVNKNGQPLNRRNTPGGTGMGAVDFDEGSQYQGVNLVSAEFGNEAGDATVMYDSMGSPDLVGTGTITLEHDGHRYQVQVAGFTGRITVNRVTE